MAIHELLTQQVKVRGNALSSPQKRASDGLVAGSTLPLSHRPGGIILGHILPSSHDKHSYLSASCSPFHQPFIFCLLSLASFLPFFLPFWGPTHLRGEREGPPQGAANT